MKINSQYSRAAVLLVALLAAVFSGCEDRGDRGDKPAIGGASAGARKPVIAVTLFPIYSIVSDLVGEWADVQLLLPPGASEHGFELTPVQLEQVSKADLLVMVGMNMDNWAEAAVKKTNRKLEVLRFADLIGEKIDDHDQDADADNDHAQTQPATTAPVAHHDHDHDHEHHGRNNHLWLDPMRTASFVNKLGEKLLPYFPAQSVSLRARVLMYSSNIVNMHQIFAAQAARFPQKNLVTFHNAFDLLAERYGLKVVAHLAEIEVSPGGEVTPQELVEAINAVKTLKLAVVYAEPQFPDHAMQAIKEQTGARVLKLDPLGNPNIDGYRTYMDMMKSNLHTIVEGQSTTKN
jgi:zinc transport system substrate-binding protein